jgi:hypothetical protein
LRHVVAEASDGIEAVQRALQDDIRVRNGMLMPAP